MSNPSDPPLILALDYSGERQRYLSGMKAARLAELAQAGFKVPAGFVLTTAAFDLFMAENGLTDGSLLAAVLAAWLPSPVEKALKAALADFENTPLAVRSSAAAEDRPDASFAGQYLTMLNVVGFKEVVQAILACWASAFGPGQAAYRQDRETGRVPVLGLAVWRC